MTHASDADENATLMLADDVRPGSGLSAPFWAVLSAPPAPPRRFAEISEADLASQAARIEGMLRLAGLQNKERLEQDTTHHCSSNAQTSGVRHLLQRDFADHALNLALGLARGPFYHPLAVARALASPRSLFWGRAADRPFPLERKPLLAFFVEMRDAPALCAGLPTLLRRLLESGEWDPARALALDADEAANLDGARDCLPSGRWPSLVETLVRNLAFEPAIAWLSNHPESRGLSPWGDLAAAAYFSAVSPLAADSSPDLTAGVRRLMMLQEAAGLDTAVERAAAAAASARGAAPSEMVPAAQTAPAEAEAEAASHFARHGEESSASGLANSGALFQPGSSREERERLFPPDPRSLEERSGVLFHAGAALLKPVWISDSEDNLARNFCSAVWKVIHSEQATLEEVWAWINSAKIPDSAPCSAHAGARLPLFMISTSRFSAIDELWQMLEKADNFDPLAALPGHERGLVDEAILLARGTPSGTLAKRWAESVPFDKIPARWAPMARLAWAYHIPPRGLANPGEEFAQWVDQQIERANLARLSDESARAAREARGEAPDAGLPSRAARRM
jgi:hypothetical protein